MFTVRQALFLYSCGNTAIVAMPAFTGWVKSLQIKHLATASQTLHGSLSIILNFLFNAQKTREIATVIYFPWGGEFGGVKYWLQPHRPRGKAGVPGVRVFVPIYSPGVPCVAC